jgi:Flp pilus assembly protein TadD
LEKGDFAGAKEHLQMASKLDPKLAQPHNYLGKIFMREGNAASAIAQFEEALRLHPDFPEAEENLRMAKTSDGGSLTLSPH